MFRKNMLLAALRSGRQCTAAWLFSGSPVVAEIVGQMRFSAVIIDREHSPGDLESTVHQMRAIRAVGDSTVLVRLSRGDAAEIKLLLDLGAEGLLMPNLETAEQARDFVAASLYPPHGTRGAHYTVSRAAGWGAAAGSYSRDYRDELFLAAMIESETGARNIPAIAAVPGIDMMFLGPLDLSGSIARMGEWEDPAYIELQRLAERSTLEAGVLLGGALVPTETAETWFSRGFSLVTVGSDVAMLRAGAAGLPFGPSPDHGSPEGDAHAHR